MKIKKYLWMLPFIASLLILWPLYGEDILRITTIGSNRPTNSGYFTYHWADTLGKTGNAYFDGTGTNDLSLNTGTDYAGTADTTVLVEVFSAHYTQNDTAVSDFDGSGEDDIVIRGLYAGTADSFWIAEILTAHYTQNDTAAVAFDGAGSVDSAAGSGTFIGTEDSVFVVEIKDTSHAAGDTIYIGAIDGTDTTGVAWYDSTTLAEAALALGAGGLSITFEVDSGHTIGDRWVFQGYGKWPDSIMYMSDAGIDTTSVTFGDTMAMTDDSVQSGSKYIVWSDTLGHTVADRWVGFGYGYWPDSIRFGADTGTDTSSWATWDDTVAVDADSNALIATVVYAIIDSLAGHTVADRWVITLHSFGEGRDTVNKDPAIGKPRLIIASDKNYIMFRTELYAAKAAINDTILVLYQNSKNPDTLWATIRADTVVGATLADTLRAAFVVDTGTFRYKYWRTLILLAGEEPDTTNYNFYGEAIIY